MNELLWTNGTGDAKALAGMAALITDAPGTGVVAGIDRALKPWWRNRAYTTAMGTAVGGTPALAAWGGGPITSAAANGGALITLLQKEYRQLTRYGGKPNTGFCGSDWLAAIESELRANGNYCMQGFASARMSRRHHLATWAPTLNTTRRSTRSARASAATGSTTATSSW